MLFHHGHGVRVRLGERSPIDRRKEEEEEEEEEARHVLIVLGWIGYFVEKGKKKGKRVSF